MQNVNQGTDSTGINQTLPSRGSAQLDATANAAQSASDNGADFENFLELLTAQLRNQDPLSPLDSTEFVAQLANFSSVEQLVNANTRLDQIATALTGADVQQYAGLIGRDVALNDASLSYTGGPIDFLSPESSEATRVTVTVRDESGAPVASFDANNNVESQSWTPQELKPGAYQLEAALYQGDQLLETQPVAIIGQIEQITFIDGEVGLRLSNGAEASVSAVRLLREARP